MYLASFGTYSSPPWVRMALSADVTDTAMGVILVYYEILQRFTNHSSNIIFGTPYFTISLSLTVILTIMIVIRLTLYNRRIRRAIGAKTTTSGVYTTVIAMLVESYALYAVNFLLFIGAWGAGNDVANLFSPILIQTQVRTLPPP